MAEGSERRRSRRYSVRRPGNKHTDLVCYLPESPILDDSSYCKHSLHGPACCRPFSNQGSVSDSDYLEGKFVNRRCKDFLKPSHVIVGKGVIVSRVSAIYVHAKQSPLVIISGIIDILGNGNAIH